MGYFDYKGLCSKLNSLVQLDIDAYCANGQAIPNIDVQAVKCILETFQADHERHFADLSPIVETYGGVPPEFRRAFEVDGLSGFTAISATGTADALKAMRGNQQTTTSTYEKALSWDLPDPVRTLIRRHFDDEMRHLRTIERWLDAEVWQQTPA